MKPTPKPRSGRYYGMPIHNVEGANDTWLEGEEFCYPNGGMTRRCFALCADGERRVVKCGIPDTYFSIPATARVHGKRVSGYVDSDETEGFRFHEYGNRGLTEGSSRGILLPNTTTIGFCKVRAQLGDIIVYQEKTYSIGNPKDLSVTHHRAARVIGFEDKDDKVYLVVLAVSDALSHCFIRWIDPEDVTECRAISAHTGKLLQWLLSPGLLQTFNRSDLEQIQLYGSMSDEYIEDAIKRIASKVSGQSLISALRHDREPMDEQGNLLGSTK